MMRRLAFLSPVVALGMPSGVLAQSGACTPFDFDQMPEPLNMMQAACILSAWMDHVACIGNCPTGDTDCCIYCKETLVYVDLPACLEAGDCGCIFADRDPPWPPDSHTALAALCPGFLFVSQPAPTPDWWVACEQEAADAAYNAYLIAPYLGLDPCAHAQTRYFVGVLQCME